MPCWGARERLLFPPGAAETTIGQRTALLYSVLQCSPTHLRPSWIASNSSGPGAYTQADQQRGAQSNLTFLLFVAANKHWERKERGREQRAALTGGCLMVLHWEALHSFSSQLLSLYSPPQWWQSYWLSLWYILACTSTHCIHILSLRAVVSKTFPFLCKYSENAHHHKFGPASVCP